MIHPRLYEQTHAVLRPIVAAHHRRQLLVKPERTERRNQRVATPMIPNHLPALVQEVHQFVGIFRIGLATLRVQQIHGCREYRVARSRHRLGPIRGRTIRIDVKELILLDIGFDTDLAE
jgi:hypothetical protein